MSHSKSSLCSALGFVCLLGLVSISLFAPRITLAQEHSGLLAGAPNEIYLIGESGVSLENVRLRDLLDGTGVAVDAFSYGRDFGHHKLGHSFFLWSIEFPEGSEKRSLAKTPHFFEPPSECAADLYWARDREETTRLMPQPHGKAADENNASPVPVDFPNNEFLRIARELGLDGTYGSPKGTSDLDGFDAWPPRATGAEDDLYFSIDRPLSFLCGGTPVTFGPSDILLLPGTASPLLCNLVLFRSAADLGLTATDDIDALAINRRGDAVIDGAFVSGVVPPVGWYSVTPSSPSLGTDLTEGDIFLFDLGETYSSLADQLHLSCVALGLCLASDVATDVDSMGHIDPEGVNGFVHWGETLTLPDGSTFDGFLGPVPIPGQPFEFGSEFGPFEGSYAVAVDDFPNPGGAAPGIDDPSVIGIVPPDPGGFAVIEFAGQSPRRDFIDLAVLPFPADPGAPPPVDGLIAQVDPVLGTVTFDWQPSPGALGFEVRINNGPPQLANPPFVVAGFDPGAVMLDVRALGPGNARSDARFAVDDLPSPVDPPEQLELIPVSPGLFDLVWQNPNPLNYVDIEIVLDQQPLAQVPANAPAFPLALNPGLHHLELRGIGPQGATVATALRTFVPIDLPPPLPPTGHAEFSAGLIPQPIASGPGAGLPGPTTLPISVPPGALVSDVEFIIRLEHPQPEVLRATLTSPAGTTLPLIEPLGVTGTVIDRHLDDLCDPSPEDNAGNHGPAGGGSIGGPGFEIFDGEPAGGMWLLTIDNHGADAGLLVNAVLRLLTVASSGEFLRGDTNADGLFDIADAVFVLGVLFPVVQPPPTAPCADATDANDDGMVDISDAVSILTALFPGGPPLGLPAPFAACGLDPTADPLDCASFPPCP